VSFDTQVRRHAREYHSRDASLAQLQSQVICLRSVELVWADDDGLAIVHELVERFDPVGSSCCLVSEVGLWDRFEAGESLRAICRSYPDALRRLVRWRGYPYAPKWVTCLQWFVSETFVGLGATGFRSGIDQVRDAQ
jgi:hypothetical protein